MEEKSEQKSLPTLALMLHPLTSEKILHEDLDLDETAVRMMRSTADLIP